MSGGLVGTGAAVDSIRRSTLQDISQQDATRKIQNQQAQTAKTTGMISGAASGAAAGFVLSGGNPAGAAIGGGIGLLAGTFL